MSDPSPWLHLIDPSGLPGKARRLAELSRHNLPVPRGLVVPARADALRQIGIIEATRSLLREGPVVVRSALQGEDDIHGSAAGLGHSELDCTDLADVQRALRTLIERCHDPVLSSYRGAVRDSASDFAIIQRQVSRRLLIVVAVPTDGIAQIEVHERGGEVLAEGHTPRFAGALSDFDDPARDAVAQLVRDTMATLPTTEHGHDLEIVVTPDDRVALVQARPLVAPLHPGWADFLATVVEDGAHEQLHGILTLDAEHNPAPLSPAHAWLMRWLAERRPHAGDPTVLAGWLYVRTLPRDLAARGEPPVSAERRQRPPEQGAKRAFTERSQRMSNAALVDGGGVRTARGFHHGLRARSSAFKPPSATTRSPSSPRSSARGLLVELHDEFLPRARERLDALSHQLDACIKAGDSNALAAHLDDATAAFLAMIDLYIGVLIPTRTKARRAIAGPPMTTTTEQPLSLLGRDEFLDVLPATWDIASPSLADLGTQRRQNDWQLPTDEAAAVTLLGEWDDHLFALGLAPVRAWFRAAGTMLSLDADVFTLHAPEVVHALQSQASAASGETNATTSSDMRALVRSRTKRQAHYATLRPPLRIDHDRPVAIGRRAYLRGIALGPSFDGRLAPRADLAALLDDPPGADAIVTLPALTAPAAVALHQLGIRALCCEHGGPLSHAALMARELGLSALIGCRGCTTLAQGLPARIDTQVGRLIVTDPADERALDPSP